MGKFISFGEINHNLKYILILVACSNLTSFLYGYNFYGTFEDVRIFSKWDNNNFASHFYIQVLLSIIFYAIEQYNIKTELKKSASDPSYKIKNKQRNNSSRIILIHNDEKKNIDNKTARFYFMLIFLLIIVELLVNLYDYFFKNLDFWMFELLIISYFFMQKRFKIKIHKHQKIAIIYNLIFPSITKLISIHLSFFDDGNGDSDIKYKCNSNCSNCNLLKDIYVVHKWLIPIGFFIYTGLLKIKWFMDIEYTPHNKILLNYGIIGVILYSFLCLTELKKCKVDSEISYVFYYYLCKIHEEQNNTDM